MASSPGDAPLRIISGSARGAKLAPVPKDVRPTSDRVRESLFNALGQFFDGGAVLDLYAGTGALGIEALSRGMERATFVEKNGKAATTIRENLRRTGMEDRAEVVRGDAARSVGRLRENGRQFNLILLDPPYRIAATEAKGVLMRLGVLLAPDGRVVVERGDAPEEVLRGEKGVTRRYGGTVVTIFDRFDLTVNVAVCPGSFDPVTVGHLDVIRRAAGVFDHVVVAVGANHVKDAMLLPADRARLIEKVTGDLDNVSVEVMEGLLVEFARDKGARVIIKGLRAVSDFNSEFEQAQLNQTLDPEVETMFIMASAKHSFLSSSAVREIAGHGGDVSEFVPGEILESVVEAYSGTRPDARRRIKTESKG